MPSSSTQFDILIIGGGIGGLAASIPLARAGHHVTIFESRPALTQLGGAIAIAANGVRVLANFGLEDMLRPYAQQDMGFDLRRWDNDEVIAQGRNEKKESSGFAHHDLKRVVLQNILYEGALEAGAKIEFGRSVKEVDVVKGRIQFADGSEREGDLLIGADGINSIVRRSIFRDQEIAHAKPSSHCFYVAELSEAALRANPAVEPLLSRPTMGAWMGPSHVMIVGSVGRAFMSHAGMSATGQGDVGDWNDSIKLSDLAEKFSGFGPAARGIIAAGEGSCYKWKIAEVASLPKWHEGKAVLLGDAAHGMYPTRGQGATQGIEDAACLGECINSAKSTADISHLLTIYEQQRKRRAEAIAASAKQLFQFFTLPDGPGQQGRDNMMRENEKKGREAAQRGAGPPDVSLKANDIPNPGPGFDIWIVRHDVISDTREALSTA